jgi:hypothetical protein
MKYFALAYLVQSSLRLKWRLAVGGFDFALFPPGAATDRPLLLQAVLRRPPAAVETSWRHVRLSSAGITVVPATSLRARGPRE